MSSFPPEQMAGEEISVKVVNASTIILRCDVNSTSDTLRVTWTRNNNTVMQDLPRIRIRNFTSSDNTTSQLRINDFRPSDTAIYECIAKDGQDTASRRFSNLRGIVI